MLAEFLPASRLERPVQTNGSIADPDKTADTGPDSLPQAPHLTLPTFAKDDVIPSIESFAALFCD